ncbi:alpha/beta hydrolase [Streptomyces sp. TRM 70361]|uniref:alpha/beta fold hydrolase n=1 Tax=Streptomyces sp. TRM 70361 TaxID=3116553 RepID=UPI002E7BD4D5|nr:alpha/beta hydrolase [Streptomyces sp. TRM 70361]MEE1941941.1 alpha/beta hydrolase [Streptomyces sp. TRM 70361]
MCELGAVDKSPKPERAETGAYWTQARDVESLREHLRQERLTIIGHSAGTRLAISYAAQYPERVARLLLVTPPSTYLVDEPADAAELIGERSGDPVFDKAVAAFQGGADLSDETAFNAWQQACAPMGYAAWTAAEQKHAQLGKFDLAAAQAFFSVQPPEDLAGRPAAVKAPTLVLGGAQDCLTGVRPVKALARLFPNGDVVLIDQCGHYPWVERPAEFRRAADTFLGGHD